MVKRKLVTVTSAGPLPEAGGIYGPIPPTRLPIQIIGKMVARDRNIYECDPKAPTDNKRWIKLTISNYNKDDNFPAENAGRGNTNKVNIVDETPIVMDTEKINESGLHVLEPAWLGGLNTEAAEKVKEGAEDSPKTAVTLPGGYQCESDSSTRKVYMVEDSLNLNDTVNPEGPVVEVNKESSEVTGAKGEIKSLGADFDQDTPVNINWNEQKGKQYNNQGKSKNKNKKGK